MKFEIFVALRYLKAKRKQTMVSVISAISIVGIAAGVMALVIALALSTGFREDVQAKIVGATSHVNLLRMDGTALADYQPLMGRLGALPHITGSAPAIFGQVFVVGSGRNQGAVLKGIDPARERQVSDFFAHITAGDPDSAAGPGSSATPDGIIVGKEMARAMGVGVGGTLQVIYPMGRLTPLGMTSSQKTFRVAAIFESGLWDFDSNWAYTAMEPARRLFGLPPDSCSALQFKTDDLERAEEIADSVREAAGAGYTTTTWIELNRPLFAALRLEKLVLFITIGLIVFVASLNIVTTLIMMVMEKQSDIAILSAMGAAPPVIMRIFVLQGFVIGVIGTLAGSILGAGACWILDTYRLIRLEAAIYSIPYVPFHVRIGDVALVAGTALLISLLATIYPARNAARLDPVEALRYE